MSWNRGKRGYVRVASIFNMFCSPPRDRKINLYKRKKTVRSRKVLIDCVNTLLPPVQCTQFTEMFFKGEKRRKKRKEKSVRHAMF